MISMNKNYFVYILANKSRTLYIGVTNHLERRLAEHQMKHIPGFTSRYAVNRLVYFESTPNISAAIEREKKIKSWNRTKKIDLIESINPQWDDLSSNWYGPVKSSSNDSSPAMRNIAGSE